jgi:hypothetical protein
MRRNHLIALILVYLGMVPPAQGQNSDNPRLIHPKTLFQATRLTGRNGSVPGSRLG